MAGKKGHYGSGGDSWRLRYCIAGKRFAKVVQGTKTEAAKELRRLIHTGDEGKHVAPSKITFGQWINDWLALKEHSTKARTVERYSDILTNHVVPVLGKLSLQKITLPGTSTSSIAD